MSETKPDELLELDPTPPPTADDDVPTPPPAKPSKPKRAKKAKSSSSSRASSSSSGKAPPMAHAAASGHMVRRRAVNGRVYVVPDWHHKAAHNLHGWGQHEHDTGSPIQLTRAEYDGALEAAIGAPPVRPYPGARSPYSKIPEEGK